MESIKPINSNLQRSSRSRITYSNSEHAINSFRNKDLAGLLLSPSACNLTVQSPSLNTGIPHILNQRVPSSYEIDSLVNSIVPSKKKSPNQSPNRSPLPDREINIARTSLQRARSGVNIGLWYENDRLKFSAKCSNRYSSRPANLYNTKSKLFPTNEVNFDKIPQTQTSRFGFINPQKEEEIANFIVNPKNAFRTHWSKHSNMKDRKFYPEMHQEYARDDKANNKRRDIITNYRESMLMVKNMMNKNENKK